MKYSFLDFLKITPELCKKTLNNIFIFIFGLSLSLTLSAKTASPTINNNIFKLLNTQCPIDTKLLLKNKEKLQLCLKTIAALEEVVKSKRLYLKTLTTKTQAAKNYLSYINLGDSNLKNKKYQLAINAYSHVLKNTPDNLILSFKRAQAFYQLNFFSLAMIDLDHIIKLDKKHILARKLKAAILTKQTQFQKALKEWTNLTNLTKKDTFIYVNKAKVLIELKRHNEAIKELNHAINLKPNIPKLYFLRGITYQKLTEHNFAIHDLTTAIRFNNKNLNNYIYRAKSYTALKKYDQAKVDYDYIFSMQKNNVINKKNIDTYIGFADFFYHQRKFTQALKYYNQIIRFQPKRAEIYLKRGNLHTKMQVYGQANADFTRAIELIKNINNKINAYLLRAKTHRKHHQLDKALADYLIVLKFNNPLIDKIEIYQEIADIYMEKEEYNNAIAFYTKSMKLQPNNSNFPLAIAKAYLTNNNNKLALNHIQNAKNIEPNNVLIYQLKAEYFYNKYIKNTLSTKFETKKNNKNNIALALIESKKAIEIAPKHIQGYFQIASLQLELKHYLDTIKTYTKILSLDKKNIQAYIQRANSFIKTKQYTKARIDLYDPLKVNRDELINSKLLEKINRIKKF